MRHFSSSRGSINHGPRPDWADRRGIYVIQFNDRDRLAKRLAEARVQNLIYYLTIPPTASMPMPR